MSKYKFISLKFGGGAYRVEMRETRQVIGFIHKSRRTYNLRRPLVLDGWIARTHGGHTLPLHMGHEDPRIFRIRDHAAQALEEAANGYT